MEESTAELYLKNKVAQIGGKAYKFVSPGVRGVPDRIVIIPGGHIYFIELKAKNKKLRPIQEIVCNQLKKLGCNVLVIDSKKLVDKFIDEVKVLMKYDF